jgi:RNA polymerase sigma-70 factor (ECF subfamily)
MAEMPVEGRPLNEQELIEGAKRGDAGAYTGLVHLHQGTALRVAYLAAGDHADAQDAVQEAFVKAFRHLARFDAARPFRPWLLRIVRNEALNIRRRARRQARVALRAASEPTSGDAAPSPESAALAGESRRILLAALATLPDRFQTVLAYRFLVGLSEAETATLLRIPRGTVKSRTARGLDRMRAAIPEGFASTPTAGGPDD